MRIFLFVVMILMRLHAEEENATLSRLNEGYQLQRAQIEGLRERIEGLASVIGAMQEVSTTQAQTLQKFSTSDELLLLRKQVAANTADIVKIKSLLEEMTKSLDRATSKGPSTPTSTKTPTLKTPIKVAPSSSVSDPKIVEKSAQEAWEKHEYARAQKGFEELLERHYHVGMSSYYLGEIAFGQKRYNDALGYYKRSVESISQGNHIPNLLLHSALAMEKIKRIKESQALFKTLIDQYPKSREAKEAKKLLK